MTEKSVARWSIVALAGLFAIIPSTASAQVKPKSSPR